MRAPRPFEILLAAALCFLGGAAFALLFTVTLSRVQMLVLLAFIAVAAWRAALTFRTLYQSASAGRALDLAV